MADLAKLKASVADLTARVKNATSVEAGVAALVQAVVAQTKELADKIAEMNPETITQGDLDDLQAQVNDSANALDEGTAALAKAAAYVPSVGTAPKAPAPGGAPDGSPPSTDPNAPGASASNPMPSTGQASQKPAPLAGTSADERSAAAEANPPAPAEAPLPPAA